MPHVIVCYKLAYFAEERRNLLTYLLTYLLKLTGLLRKLRNCEINGFFCT